VAKSSPKKKLPSAPASAATPERRDSVGWTFWLVTFGVLVGPCWYLAYRSVYESEKEGFVPYVLAGALAALGAGLLSFSVNLYYRVRAENEKKAARKSKKQARDQ
jgi:hypothetical protein